MKCANNTGEVGHVFQELVALPPSGDDLVHEPLQCFFVAHPCCPPPRFGRGFVARRYWMVVVQFPPRVHIAPRKPEK